ncbi:unnamed protein product, partial [Acanthoscelides obtectus]
SSDLDDFPTISTTCFFRKKKAPTVIPTDLHISDVSDDDFSDGENISQTNELNDEEEVPSGLDMLVPESNSEFEESEDETEPPPPQRRKTESYSWIEADIVSANIPLPDFPEPDNIAVLIEYFTKFFSFDLMDKIVYQTNLYSTQQLGQCIDTNPSEITDFVSILLWISLIHRLDVRLKANPPQITSTSPQLNDGYLDCGDSATVGYGLAEKRGRAYDGAGIGR